MKCDGCGRHIWWTGKYKEYYVKYDGKNYCSRYCINKHLPDRDLDQEIEMNYIPQGRIVSCAQDPPHCSKCRDYTICHLPKKFPVISR